MEPDSTGTYERFNPPSDYPPTAPDEQQPNQLQSPSNVGNRPGQFGTPFGNTPSGNTPLGNPPFGNPPYNQPNTGRPNRRSSMADFKLTKEEQSVLNGCKTTTLFGMTLPLCATYVIYSKYNALRMLKPVSNWSMYFNTAFIFMGARFLSMAMCLQVLRQKCPDFDNRVRQFRNQVQHQYGQPGARPSYPPAYPPAGQQNPAPNNQDYQNWQRQRFNNPKNPYLATNQQNQSNEDEFVQDNYDSGKSGSQ